MDILIAFVALDSVIICLAIGCIAIEIERIRKCLEDHK